MLKCSNLNSTSAGLRSAPRPIPRWWCLSAPRHPSQIEGPTSKGSEGKEILGRDDRGDEGRGKEGTGGEEKS